MARFATLLLLAGLAAGTAAADGEDAVAPERLSETGLYLDIASRRVDDWNLPFTPQYQLWSDGAVKTRWIRIPDGATIDARDTDAWVFPVGTKFWKEFAFGERKVETRMLWRTSETTWVFASYAWNDEQTEAFLASADGIRNCAPIAKGASHSIPSVADCKTCHESGPTVVLGFNALQLSDDRDPIATHAAPLRPGSVTLRTLDTYRLLTPRRRDLVDDPPRINARSSIERAALGYLTANCGHCHNARGPLSSVGMVLAHTSRASLNGNEPAIATLGNVPGSYIVPGTNSRQSRRVAAKNPDASALIHRMSSRRPSTQMPPLGTVLVDTEAVELMKLWVRGWPH